MYNVIGMFRNSWSENKSGFTIIELLVTVALIAVLSAGVYAAIGQHPKMFARDTRRKTDLQTIGSAFEMYRNDCSAYPASYPGGLPVAYLANPPKDPQTSSYYALAACPAASVVNTACGGGLCKIFSICATLENDGVPTQTCVTNP
jgi:prepilin-type N-terminal cleavage/methylation domain-containing protein